MLLMVATLLFVLPASEQFLMDCNYRQFTLTSVVNAYTCEAFRIIKAPGDQSIDRVSQNHLAGRIDRDVRAFLMDRSPLDFIPQNMAQFWPLLELIAMRDSEITTLVPEELRGLRSLRQISLAGSKIVSLQPGLFLENPLMREVSLMSNPLSQVGSDVFEPLQLLTHLDMRSTSCMNEIATNRAGIELMVLRVMIRCPFTAPPPPPPPPPPSPPIAPEVDP